MSLDRVTVTGADDSIDPEALGLLTKKYPFVEWGVLFSASRQGNPRYPSKAWIGKLATISSRPDNLCAHLCGQWVRDLVLDGNWSWWDSYGPLPGIFKRIQLNFHGQYHKAGGLFPRRLRQLGERHQFILQHDGVNDETILKLGGELNVFPLFDRSGGAGVLPAAWPKPIWKYQGYAGGLSPDNIEDELRRILDAAGESHIWIDVETRVRSEDDSQFDLGKVELFLKRCQPFVRVQS